MKFPLILFLVPLLLTSSTAADDRDDPDPRPAVTHNPQLEPMSTEKSELPPVLSEATSDPRQEPKAADKNDLPEVAFPNPEEKSTQESAKQNALPEATSDTEQKPEPLDEYDLPEATSTSEPELELIPANRNDPSSLRGRSFNLLGPKPDPEDDLDLEPDILYPNQTRSYREDGSQPQPRQSSSNNRPRRLHPFKNFVSHGQFDKKYWPPRKEVGGALDLSQNGDGYKEWQDIYEKKLEAYNRHEQALKKAEDAAAQGVGYKGPARPYPYCVSGFKPLFVVPKNQREALLNERDQHNRQFRRNYYSPDKGSNALLDEDLYHFMALFEMSQPYSGEPAVSDNLDGRAPAKDIQHFNQDGNDEGPYITRIDKFYVDSPPTGANQRDGTGGGMAYTGEGGDKIFSRHLPNWMHIVVRSRVKLEGLYLQAIAFPSGLPFGKFVDDFDCSFDGGGREGAGAREPIGCTKDETQYKWREGAPKKRVKTIHYCRYGHGSNDGDMYPTVYAFGGQRFMRPGAKFDTFRTLFTWTGAHCNYKMRWQLLVLAVKSFINAEFEAYLTANVILGETRKSGTTPPLIEDWRNRLTCNRPITQASNPDVSQYGLASSDPLNEEANMNLGVMEVFLSASSTIPIPYSKEYDNCVYDVMNVKGLLDEQWNCPPKNLCLNLEQPLESWDKSSNLQKYMGTPQPAEYYNLISFHRFPRFFQRFFADRQEVWDKMKSCVVGKAKRCRPPEESIPHIKPEEAPKGDLSPANCDPSRIRQLDGAAQAQARAGEEGGGAAFFKRRGGHKFSDKLYRGFFRAYYKFSKKSRITHIWTMTLAWFVLLFVGIYTARYYKETGGINPDTGNSWQGLGYWFWFHVTLLLLSMTFMWIGISEAISIRRKPPSCNMFQSFPDLSLKLFCRWRKQNVRIHQQIGLASLVLFHVALIFAWSRPVRLWNNINFRKVFLFIHIFSAYLGKIFCFACVCVLFFPRGNRAICPDIPALIVIAEFIGLVFFVIGWILQFLEDRVEGREGRRHFPVIEAIVGGVDASKKCYMIKVIVMMVAVFVHLLLLAFVCLTLRQVYWKDFDKDAEAEGKFEDRHGWLGVNCSVPSQETVMKALYLKYFKDRQDQ